MQGIYWDTYNVETNSVSSAVCFKRDNKCLRMRSKCIDSRSGRKFIVENVFSDRAYDAKILAARYDFSLRVRFWPLPVKNLTSSFEFRESIFL